MSFDLEKIYALLPAYARVRDAERGAPLKALLSVIAEQVAVLEDDLAQLYDDQFIETCADWAVPYIGDLVGARSLFVFKSAAFSQRALVANTLRDRRRKGTLASIQAIAHDSTAWDASVVEYFQQLTTTQYMKHLRPGNLMMPDLRDVAALSRLTTPFDAAARTFEARRIETSRGRYNIPNIGIFLWRIGAHAVTFAPPAGAGAGRFRFDPLGRDAVLYAQPEDDPFGVPEPITRRALIDDLKSATAENRDSRYYGVDRSVAIRVGNDVVGFDQVECCDLSDIGGGQWARQPGSTFVIDPVLGRLLVPATLAVNAVVRVKFHYGFAANIGGGEYARAVTFAADLAPVVQVEAAPEGTASPSFDTIQPALDALGAGGVVEIVDDEVYSGPLAIHSPGRTIELRAADGRRPILRLQGDAQLTGDPPGTDDAEASITLNGLIIVGGALHVPAGTTLKTLRLRHCTVMPGSDSALLVDEPDCTVEIDSCIIGGIGSVDDASVVISNSIVDAGRDDETAYAGVLVDRAGGALQIRNSTVIGRVRTRQLTLASNSIFLAASADPAEPPVLVDRLQDGCVRFSYVPPGSRVPRRFRCQPEDGEDDRIVRPVLRSHVYGNPAYGQLDGRCPVVIREGADDGAEMGAFHDLFQPQRVSNLRARLDEYLRFGLEAGIFFAS
jgi:hypothetical protein